jgi:CheY-like chemotaxis protein
MKSEPAVPVRGKVLVVDDNPVIQRSVYFALRDAGYKVVMIGEVYGAINIIREEQPDVLLLDLSFPADPGNIGGPTQDGFFFIEWVRRTPEVERVPIIIISSSDPATYQERVAASGVNVFLRKPLDKAALINAVQTVIEKNSQNRPPGLR